MLPSLLYGGSVSSHSFSDVPFFAETCRCYKNIYVAWHKKAPYITRDSRGHVLGIFPSILKGIVRHVCGQCGAFGYSRVFFNRSKSGRDPIKHTAHQLRMMVSNLHQGQKASGRTSFYDHLMAHVQLVCVCSSNGGALARGGG